MATKTVEVPEALTYTVQFSHKRGLPNYSSEEAGIFVQVPIEADNSQDEVVLMLKHAFDLAKTQVYERLGLPLDYDPANAPQAPKPQRASGARKATAPKASKPNADAAEGWADLKANPDRWWDNREDKRNPRAPDFKHKDSGQGLWLDSKDTPEWAALQYGLNAEEA